MNIVESKNFKSTWYIFRKSGVEVAVKLTHQNTRLESELPLSQEEREYFEREIVKKPLKNLWMK